MYLAKAKYIENERPEPDSNRRITVLQTVALDHLAIGPGGGVLIESIYRGMAILIGVNRRLYSYFCKISKPLGKSEHCGCLFR